MYERDRKLSMTFLTLFSIITVSFMWATFATSKTSELDRTITAVVFDSTCRTNIFTSREDGLFGNIKLAEKLIKAMKISKNEKNYVLADSSGPQNEIGILNEVIYFPNGVLSPNHSKIEMVSSKCDTCKESKLAEDLVKLIDSSFPKGKALSVLVTEDRIGDTTLETILEKCYAHGREVATFGLLNKTDIRRQLSRIGNMRSHIVILDCHGYIAAEILKMAKNMGLAGIGSHFHWILTERAMMSLPLSWYLPNKNVYGIKLPNFTEPRKNFSFLLSAAMECKSSKTTFEKIMEEGKENRRRKAVLFKLEADASNVYGKIWKKTLDNSIRNEGVHHNGNPLLPRLRVAFANPYPPWLSAVDFAKTAGEEFRCGRNGRYGYRYANTTSNVKVPICAYGLNIDILRYLEEMSGFVGEIHITKDGRYGSVNESSGKPDGILGALYRNESDFAIDLAFNPSRRGVVEFTSPYDSFAYSALYMKRNRYNDSGVLGPFSSKLWWTMLGMIAGLVLFIWAVERFGPYGRTEKKNRTIESYASFGFLDSINYMWGLFFCGEIITEKPVSTSSRATLIVMSFVSILFVSLYSANLTAFLVVVDDTPLVKGLHDPKLVGDNSKLKACIVNGIVTERFLQNNIEEKVRQLYKRMTHVETHEECMKKLRSREIDLVMLEDLTAQYEIGIDKACVMQTLLLTPQVGGTGLSYMKNFSWKQKFNEAALKMAASGIKDELFKKWHPKRDCKITSDFQQLGKKHLRMLFLWISIGAGICILLATFAYLYNYFRHVLCTKQNVEENQ